MKHTTPRLTLVLVLFGLLLLINFPARAEPARDSVAALVGGSLRGQVLDQSFLPIPNITVNAFNSFGVGAGVSTTDAVGRFTISGLAAGTYYLRATSPYHLDEVYPDLLCEGGACNVLAGTPIALALDGEVTGLNFVLSRLARLRGSVVEATSGNPVVNARVTILDEFGATLRTFTTDPTGLWDVGDLAAGTYYAKASHPVYEEQLYDGIACPDVCAGPGTPLVLSEGALVDGVNFSLSRLGAISGSIRASGTLELLSGTVEVYDAAGQLTRQLFTSTGLFTVQTLPTGNYFVRTNQTSGIYLNELWQDIPCFLLACNPTTGTPVAVALEQTTGGIDFVLERLGRIEGQIIDGLSAAPIASAMVRAYESGTGAVAKTTTSDQQGFYSLTGLGSGNYKVSAGKTLYRSELWNGVLCGATCDPSLGQDVAVALDQTTPGINFALEAVAHIGGKVRDEATNLSLPGAMVTITDSIGVSLGTVTADANGDFRMDGLADGNYFALAFSNDGAYFSEIYSGIDCKVCPPVTTGSVIAVSVGNNRDDVDFTLQEGGRIEGTVIQTSGGLPASGGSVRIFDAGGQLTGDDTPTPSTGAYSVVGLETGTYYAVYLSFAAPLASEVWPDIVCPYASTCNPLLGTTISVVQGAATTVHFSIDSMGSVHGHAVDAETGVPISGGTFAIYDSVGMLRAQDNVDASGEFFFDGLGTDDYKISSSNNANYIEQVFGGTYCENQACDLSSGTAVQVQIGQLTEAGDFALEAGPGVAGFVLRDGSPAANVGVDIWNTDGTYVGFAGSSVSGRYRKILLPGSYYVTTDNGPSHFDEVWNNVLCPDGPAYLGLCDPTSGDLVVVLPNEPATDGINFDIELREPVLFSDDFESGDFGAWSLVLGN